MRPGVGLLALALAVALAGCAGGQGTTTDTPTPSATVSPTPTPTPATAAAGHPYVAADGLDARGLVRDHVTALREAGSYTVTNNGTATFVGNGTGAGRVRATNRVNLTAERQHLVFRSEGVDGAQTKRHQYANASTTCSVTGGEVTCQDGGFSERRAVGLVVETTALETVAGPAFEVDGTVERDGRTLYRYRATSFREPLPDGVVSEIGQAPVLDSATLLVSPPGIIVEYRITFERGTGDARQERSWVYRIRGVGSTTVEPPAALASG